MDRGAWPAAVHGVTSVGHTHTHTHTHALTGASANEVTCLIKIPAIAFPQVKLTWLETILSFLLLIRP